MSIDLSLENRRCAVVVILGDLDDFMRVRRGFDRPRDQM